MTGTLRVRRDMVWKGDTGATESMGQKIGLNKSENQSTSDQPVRHVKKKPKLI